MWTIICKAFVIATIGCTILPIKEVDAQSTVDDSASCESSTFDDAVILIREDLKDVKNLLGSNQQQRSPMECSDSTQALVSSLSSNCIPLLIQQNVHGSDFFNRSWEEFKVGFNDSSGNYWLGNDLLSQLTQSGNYKLKFDLHAANGTRYWAEYSSFTVLSEASNYTLLVSGYSGNAGDALYVQNTMMFTTYDRDNDPWKNDAYNDNCAVVNGGGFWYSGCARCAVNNVRGRGDSFRWRSSETENILLQMSRMWLTC